MLRWNFDPSKTNYYRGWFPLQPTAISYKEGIDMGPDVAHSTPRTTPADPLPERTPLPAEATLPGWRAAAAHYYESDGEVGAALMASIARSLKIGETTFDGYFRTAASRR